jgi:WD40 repeat protein
VAHRLLYRRWERSRNGSTTHIPVHSTISGMHQMVSNGLLTSSVEYGIVARSIPLTGKILSGYLDASGSATGLGIGNPNAEFTPNMSACGLASNGGTAKLVWGSRVGDVVFMSVSKAMETGSRRSAAEVKRCSVVDEHEGAVVDAVWLNVQSGWVVTGGADARVKLWDAKNATSVWTSQQVFDSVIPDSCVKVAGSAQHGFVVGVFKSGHVRIWAGFDFTQSTVLADSIKEIAIDNPIRTSTEGYDSSANHDVTTLNHDASASHISVLVGYENDCYFHRIQVDLFTLDVQTLAFGEPYAGSISTIAPFFSTDKTESSVIFAGDHLGCINLYDWDADPHNVDPRTNAIGPLKQFEAHKSGTSVTTIAWNGLVLVSGSVRGDVQVFDGMTFELLRKFESPHPPLRRSVGTDLGEIERQRKEKEKVRVLLLGTEKDVVFMGIGDKVVAWKAGPVPKYIKGGVRSRNVPSWGRGKRPGQGLKHFGK